ncbi:MAG: polysaccharide export protein, partial [Candidatus Electrothrix sp. AR3]|nr:polysaccharide export protein [Candidatus Electrothrix sp. AR3]
MKKLAITMSLFKLRTQKKMNKTFLSLFCLTILVACGNKKTEVTIDTYPVHEQKTEEIVDHRLDTDEVQLAAGDTVNIKVWGQEDLNEQMTLDLKGNIYYPLIGKVKAQGLTLAQLQSRLVKKLSVYYVTPQVTVIPVNLAGQHYYILGEVNNPGKFTLKAQTSVLEATAVAGGPNDDAGDMLVLFRKQKKKLQMISLPLQLDGFAKKNMASAAMEIQANDILFLPPSTIASVEKFMKRL